MKKIAVILLMFLLPVPVASIEEGGCAPPYDPTNMLKTLFYYSETMDYIAYGPEQCRRNFAQKVRKVVTDTILMSDGCIDVTLHDIDKALEKKYAPRFASKKRSDQALSTGLK